MGGRLHVYRDRRGLAVPGVVIDLFSRKVAGWSMRPDMQRDLVIDALEMVWFRRCPDKKAGLIFHSDRGSQYASKEFSDVLKERKRSEFLSITHNSERI
jgi:transposase InsO family protein